MAQYIFIIKRSTLDYFRLLKHALEKLWFGFGKYRENFEIRNIHEALKMYYVLDFKQIRFSSVSKVSMHYQQNS